MKKTIICCAAACALSLPAAVSFDAAGHVYAAGRAPVASSGAPGAKFSLADWRGRPVGGGEFDAEGKARLPPLPTGYYHLRSGGASAAFAVVPDPRERRFDHSSFYGVDSAQSWISRRGAFLCPWNDGDTFRTVSDLLQLAGIPHVRERLSWGEANPSPGTYRYGHYMLNADMLRDRGILVSGMFHDAPAWAGRLKKLPADLAKVYEFCARTAAEFGGRMGDWEFWNEEDIGFAPDPVWDYAAALKAAYLGFKAARPGAAALPGALCQRPDSLYARALFANDAAKFCDVFNYHTYNHIAEYPAIFAKLRAFMKRHGIGDRAIWMTECGSRIEGHSKTPGVKKGLMAHSPEQELVVAEFYPKSQIALQMEGVARNYFFVFGAYNEANGAKDWGVMRRDGTVKPVYAAISTMTRELVSARLAGEIDVGKGLRAYLFDQPDGSQTVAFWSVSDVDVKKSGQTGPSPEFSRTVSIPAPDGPCRVSDLCGMERTVFASNGVISVEATRFPSYASGLHGLAARVPARRPGSVKPYAPAADEDLSVIVRVDLSTNDFKVSAQKTRAVLKSDFGRLRLQVWNMGASAKTGHVEVAGGSLKGLPETIALGPRGTPPAEFDCVLEPDGSGGYSRQIEMSGVFGGRRSSRLSLAVLMEKKFLESCEVAPIDWRNLEDWKRNTSAQSYKASWDEAEQAVRFEVAWTDPHTDRWFYPVYNLKLPQESFAGAQLFEFEVKSEQDKVENDFNTQNLMLLFSDKGKTSRFLSYSAPLGGWETRSVELSDLGKSLRDVTAFRLGANPKGMKCTFWIRGLRLLKAKR